MRVPGAGCSPPKNLNAHKRAELSRFLPLCPAPLCSPAQPAPGRGFIGLGGGAAALPPRGGRRGGGKIVPQTPLKCPPKRGRPIKEKERKGKRRKEKPPPCAPQSLSLFWLVFLGVFFPPISSPRRADQETSTFVSPWEGLNFTFLFFSLLFPSPPPLSNISILSDAIFQHFRCRFAFFPPLPHIISPPVLPPFCQSLHPPKKPQIFGGGGGVGTTPTPNSEHPRLFFLLNKGEQPQISLFPTPFPH